MSGLPCFRPSSSVLQPELAAGNFEFPCLEQWYEGPSHRDRRGVRQAGPRFPGEMEFLGPRSCRSARRVHVLEMSPGSQLCELGCERACRGSMHDGHMPASSCFSTCCSLSSVERSVLCDGPRHVARLERLYVLAPDESGERASIELDEQA